MDLLVLAGEKRRFFLVEIYLGKKRFPSLFPVSCLFKLISPLDIYSDVFLIDFILPTLKYDLLGFSRSCAFAVENVYFPSY